MEITDEKLRQIVRETLRELGPEADPALVRKVVRDVIRHLSNDTLPGRPSFNPAPKSAPNISMEPATIRLSDKITGNSSRQEY